ncbi:MAG TPA: cytochrome c [Verrucomicrobiae bacterium]|jgi:mono/diheme cytochrome c family protein|nr:cytochrome c [Verrucomicrobiae bacterium]
MRRGTVIAGLIAVALSATGCGAHRAATNAASRASVAPLSPSAARGRAIYADNCSACHGADAAGGQLGPMLRGERARRTDAQIAAAILNPTPPMPKLSPAQLSAQDVADVTAYVETL